MRWTLGTRRLFGRTCTPLRSIQLLLRNLHVTTMQALPLHRTPDRARPLGINNYVAINSFRWTSPWSRWPHRSIQNPPHPSIDTGHVLRHVLRDTCCEEHTFAIYVMRSGQRMPQTQQAQGAVPACAVREPVRCAKRGEKNTHTIDHT